MARRCCPQMPAADVGTRGVGTAHQSSCVPFSFQTNLPEHKKPPERSDPLHPATPPGSPACWDSTSDVSLPVLLFLSPFKQVRLWFMPEDGHLFPRHRLYFYDRAFRSRDLSYSLERCQECSGGTMQTWGLYPTLLQHFLK